MVVKTLARTKLSTLIAVAGGLGIGCGALALLLGREKDKYVNQAPFVNSAISIVKRESEVMNLLGDNLEVGPATLQDGWGRMEKTNIRVKVPIKGEKDKAQLFAYARRRKNVEKYKLFKLEMTFDKVKGKKLVLMDLGDLPPEEEEKEEKEEKEKKEIRPDDPFANLLVTDPNKKKTNHFYK